MRPPEKVMPTPTLKMCISMKDSPAYTQWTAYIRGATKIKVNSRGSVTPVSMAVRAAEISRPPATFFFSGLAVRYIANAAPGRPKIMKGNLPAINRVASTENTSVDLDASSAKKMFCAPWMVTPSTTAVPPTAVCQKGI